MATASIGETTKKVISHLLKCFGIMGVPMSIKTDNEPANPNKTFQAVCNDWHIQHLTGIPYNPQAQGIIGRTHKELNTMLQKWGGGTIPSPLTMP